MSECTLPDETQFGITMRQYQALCLHAFLNLRSDTQVSIDDVDSILTWCVPELDRMRAENAKS